MEQNSLPRTTFGAVQILLILLFPALAVWSTRRLGIDHWLSPVVLCYALGIVLASCTGFPIDETTSHRFAEGTVLLAIPLLLYSTDLRAWVRSARTMLGSFAIIVVAVLLMTFLMGTFARDWVPDSATVSGMLVGLYVGGSPDMNAVGLALGAPGALFVYLNIADIVVGGVYLLFLTSVAPWLYGKWLPAYVPVRTESLGGSDSPGERTFHWRDAAGGFLLTLFVVAFSAGLTYLFTGALESIALIVLLLTTFALALSMVRDIRTLRGTYETGEYLLLMFCVAIGMLADFGQAGAAVTNYVAYTATVLVGSVGLHLLFARLFKLDRDTVMITGVAALYGPVFIGQIASVLRNRAVVAAGIGTSLVGYALGNYLGLLMTALLERVF